MSVVAEPSPLPALESYPERADVRHHWLDRLESAITAAPQDVLMRLRRRRHHRALARINALEADLTSLSDAALRSRGRDLRAALHCAGLQASLTAAAFASVREVSRRALGLRHYDVQILGGLVLLDGAVAEMDTGEGKTLTATLAAVTAGLAGIPVHVITVNDYLAVRDAESLRPIFDFFDLKVGVVTSDLPASARAKVYACDIVYASNKEIAFDYLRDRIVLGNQPNFLRAKLRPLIGHDSERKRVVMRGLHFAIVDEADSVLIDEAGTPLIISRQTNQEEERAWTQEAFRLVEGLAREHDYRLIVEDRRIELTDRGKSLLSERGELMGGMWTHRIRRDEAARQALTALLLFKRGEHYLVHDGKVQIVDEYTGRLMPDRSWSDGLHQLIEAKEGCEVTARKQSIARLTSQRFYRRYLRLAGMTGTAREVRSELWAVYRLMVCRVPPHRPSRRRRMMTTLCRSHDAKLATIVARAQEMHRDRRPVLIGTRSVAASQAVSGRLSDAGLEHVILNAERSADEAAVIAQAGRVGRITVATNIAGRGVHIALDPTALACGGLHVILTERHDARRIDRQLEGRCARGGEAGSVEHVLSLDDKLLDVTGAGRLRGWACGAGAPARWLGLLLFTLAQRRAERSHSRQRKNLLAQDRRLSVLLAFSGGAD